MKKLTCVLAVLAAISTAAMAKDRQRALARGEPTNDICTLAAPPATAIYSFADEQDPGLTDRGSFLLARVLVTFRPMRLKTRRRQDTGARPSPAISFMDCAISNLTMAKWRPHAGDGLISGWTATAQLFEDRSGSDLQYRHELALPTHRRARRSGARGFIFCDDGRSD